MSTSYIAGIVLLDLVQNSVWTEAVFQAHPEVVQDLCKTLLQIQFAEYAHRNVQAKTVAKLLITLYYSNSAKNQPFLTDLFQMISEAVTEQEGDQVDIPIRTLIYFLEQVESETRIKEFHPYVPYIL